MDIELHIEHSLPPSSTSIRFGEHNIALCCRALGQGLPRINCFRKKTLSLASDVLLLLAICIRLKMKAQPCRAWLPSILNPPEADDACEDVAESRFSCSFQTPESTKFHHNKTSQHFTNTARSRKGYDSANHTTEPAADYFVYHTCLPHRASRRLHCLPHLLLALLYDLQQLQSTRRASAPGVPSS